MNEKDLEDLLRAMPLKKPTALPDALASESQRRFLFFRMVHRPRSLAWAAAVAAGVVVILGLLTWLAPGRPRPGLLFADVLEKVRSVRSVKYTSTATQEGGPSTVAEILCLEPGRARITETPTGEVTIIDIVADRALFLYPKTKKASLVVSEGRTEPAGGQPEGLFAKVAKLREGAEEELGQRVIGGRTVSGFRGRLEGSEWVIWADAQTGLPVRMEGTSPLAAPGWRMVMTDFQWDIPLDESLFSLTPPSDYTVVEKSEGEWLAQASELACEGRLAQIAWACVKNNEFPERLSDLLPYLTGPELLRCPATGKEYIYVKPTPAALFIGRRSGKIMLVFDEAGNHPGWRNVLFDDLRTRRVTEEEFQKLWADQQTHATPEDSPPPERGQAGP
jgi:outer membrane lipoprotein-sorting protein